MKKLKAAWPFVASVLVRIFGFIVGAATVALVLYGLSYILINVCTKLMELLDLGRQFTQTNWLGILIVVVLLSVGKEVFDFFWHKTRGHNN